MAYLQNASNHLTTPTYDGSGEVVHVSVIDFLTEHNMYVWGGYRYWMAMTPLPGNELGVGDDSLENPSILVSNNGTTWVVPNGITNPLDALPGSYNYNSDVELVYDPNENCLRVYWREFYLNQYIKIWMMKIYSDCLLGTKTLCITLNWADGKDTLSPTIWIEDSNSWHMWAIQGVPNSNVLGLEYRTSMDGILWSDATFIDDPIPDWKTGWYSWHISSKYNKWENRMEFCIVAEDSNNKCNLAYAQCIPSTPTTITTPLSDWVLETSVSGWDNSKLYRSSFVIHPNIEYKWKLWYTSYGNNYKDRFVGFTEGFLPTDINDIAKLCVVNGEDIYKKVFDLSDVVYTGLRTNLNNSIKYFKLVDLDDPSATKIRTNTPAGVKSVVDL